MLAERRISSRSANLGVYSCPVTWMVATRPGKGRDESRKCELLVEIRFHETERKHGVTQRRVKASRSPDWGSSSWPAFGGGVTPEQFFSAEAAAWLQRQTPAPDRAELVHYFPEATLSTMVRGNGEKHVSGSHSQPQKTTETTTTRVEMPIRRSTEHWFTKFS